MPRAISVFAHPDDETVALGARMGRFSQVYFVHVTDGAPRNEEDSRRYGFPSYEEYRQARVKELDSALALAGIESAEREELRVPDQRASHNLLAITLRLAELLNDRAFEVVFTHPYEGGHPDHDACAFAAHHAVAMQKVTSRPASAIIECSFYHADPQGVGGTYIDSFLPADPATPQIVYALSASEQQRKRERMACFTAQRETLNQFPLTTERYRIAPRYDFRKEPHLPPVLYDRYPWGMNSRRFCELAIEAEQLLLQRMKEPA